MSIIKSPKFNPLLQAVRSAGEEAVRISESDFAVYRKEDKSPVTEADYHVNEAITQIIQDLYPDDLIIGEETQGERPKQFSERTWFLDPIDGTQELTDRGDEWSTILGLAVNQEPFFGLVHWPKRNLTYWAEKGQGAFKSDGTQTQKLRANKKKKLAEATVACSRNHPHKRTSAFAKKVGIPGSKLWEHGSVGLKIALIADGQADLYLNFGGVCHLWDVCGAQVIIEEAGGTLKLQTGEAISYQGPETRINRPFMSTINSLETEVLHQLSVFST